MGHEGRKHGQHLSLCFRSGAAPVWTLQAHSGPRQLPPKQLGRIRSPGPHHSQHVSLTHADGPSVTPPETIYNRIEHKQLKPSFLKSFKTYTGLFAP